MFMNVSFRKDLFMWHFMINHNFIQVEIKSRLKSGNACYQSVQNLLSSNLLPKHLKN